MNIKGSCIEKKRVCAVVRGRVQGVGFRYFTRDRAQKVALTGWVANMDDGAVAFEAQGKAGDIEAFLEAVKEGPALAYVSDMTVNELPVEEDEKGFEIKT
jgi:acylphosphatase